MNIRDLPLNTIKRLASEADDAFDDWYKVSGGLTFSTKTPVEAKDIWRLAFSKGCSAVLRRVDKLKED